MTRENGIPSCIFTERSSHTQLQESGHAVRFPLAPMAINLSLVDRSARPEGSIVAAIVFPVQNDPQKQPFGEVGERKTLALVDNGLYFADRLTHAIDREWHARGRRKSPTRFGVMALNCVGAHMIPTNYAPVYHTQESSFTLGKSELHGVLGHDILGLREADDPNNRNLANEHAEIRIQENLVTVRALARHPGLDVFYGRQK